MLTAEQFVSDWMASLLTNPRLFARFSDLPLSILSIRLSPLVTSSSSNGHLVLLVQVLLEMVNWSDPAEIARDSGMPADVSGETFWFFEFRGLGAFLKLTYTLFGAYVWELFMTCDFEWSLITRRRRFRWPLVRWLSIFANCNWPFIWYIVCLM